MTTTTDNRSHRHRRTALTGVLAAVAVAGGLAASPSAAVQTASTSNSTAGSASSSASNDVVLRPDGDVRAFAVTKGASAASVLDEAVTSRSRVPRGDAIRAGVAGATTTVTLGGRIRSGLRPTGARAWFFAGTGSGTSLRVEVVCHGGPEGTPASLGHASRMWALARECGVPAVLTALIGLLVVRRRRSPLPAPVLAGSVAVPGVPAGSPAA